MSDDDENEEGGEGGVGWWKWLWIIGIALILATALAWGLRRWNRPAPPAEPATQEQVATPPPPVNPANAVGEAWAVTCTTATAVYTTAKEAKDITSCYAKLQEGEKIRLPYDGEDWGQADPAVKQGADKALEEVKKTRADARATFETLVKEKIKGSLETLKPLTDAPGLDRLLERSIAAQEAEEKETPDEFYLPDTVKEWLTADVGRFFFKAAGIPDDVMSELAYDVSPYDPDDTSPGKEMNLEAYSLRFSSWFFKSLRMRWASRPDELWAFYQAHKSQALEVIKTPGVNLYKTRQKVYDFRVSLEDANKPGPMTAWKSWERLKAAAEAEKDPNKKTVLEERRDSAKTAWEEAVNSPASNTGFGFRRRLEGGEAYLAMLIKICDDYIASIDAIQ